MLTPVFHLSSLPPFTAHPPLGPATRVPSRARTAHIPRRRRRRVDVSFRMPSLSPSRSHPHRSPLRFLRLLLSCETHTGTVVTSAGSRRRTPARSIPSEAPWAVEVVSPGRIHPITPHLKCHPKAKDWFREALLPGVNPEPAKDGDSGSPDHHASTLVEESSHVLT